MTVSSRRVSDGLVMVCDVDLAVPDATRVHTVEVARNFAAEGLAVDLVARGPDPHLEGVRYLQGQGADSQRATRVATLNAGVLRLLWSRRGLARRLYVRYRWSLMPVLIAGACSATGWSPRWTTSPTAAATSSRSRRWPTTCSGSGRC